MMTIRGAACLSRALAAGLFSSVVWSREASAQVLGARPARLPPGKSIYRIEGEVLVNGQPATVDTQIAANATVETGQNSEVVYVVGETAFLQRSESQVTLEATQADSMIVSGTQMLTGKILSVFPSGKPVRMTTKNASIGIRGTGVYMESDPEQTYFCTCYGTADIVAVSDPQAARPWCRANTTGRSTFWKGSCPGRTSAQRRSSITPTRS